MPGKQMLCALVLSGFYVRLPGAAGEKCSRGLQKRIRSRKPDQSVKGSFSDQHVLILDSTNIRKILGKFPQLGKYASDVQKFYAYRNYSYAWYETSGMIEQANHLYTRLNDIQDEGILEKPPYINMLDSLINDPLVTGKADSVLEILLTAEYIFYADRVWNGIPENQTI